MNKKLAFATLLCCSIRAMNHESEPTFQLPAFTRIKTTDELKLPTTEEPDYTYLTFDEANDGFFSAADADSSITSLTLHTHKPTGNVAFGRAPARGEFELFSDCDRPITGFDACINPENSQQKAFIVCRSEGWCTLFNLDEGSIVDKWITAEDLLAVYFESRATVICIDKNSIYRWNFTNNTVIRVGTPSVILQSKKNSITVPKNLLNVERSESSNDSSDEDESTQRGWLTGLKRVLNRIFS